MMPRLVSDLFPQNVYRDMIVYKATNNVNGKMYIGQTVKTLEYRRKKHNKSVKEGNCPYFYRALLKYGKDNFKWEVICICPNVDILNEQEQYYIAFYNSMNERIGYNLTSGGLNCVVSGRTKEKCRQASLGKNNPNYGKKHSPEQIQKIKDNHVGFRGKKHSEKTKKLMSKSNVKYMLGKKMPETIKKKISSKMKLVWQDPTYREKILRARGQW